MGEVGEAASLHHHISSVGHHLKQYNGSMGLSDECIRLFISNSFHFTVRVIPELTIVGSGEALFSQPHYPSIEILIDIHHPWL